MKTVPLHLWGRVGFAVKLTLTATDPLALAGPMQEEYRDLVLAKLQEAFACMPEISFEREI